MLGVPLLAQLPRARWHEIDALPARIARRARHVVRECARVDAAIAALGRNDLDRFGALLLESHASLRDDFDVSTPELDAIVDEAVRSGALGARMTGGGFGGSTVTLCESRKAADIAATLAEEYEKATGITPEIFASRPSMGAHLVK